MMHGLVTAWANKSSDAIDAAITLAQEIRRAPDDLTAARLILTRVFSCVETACDHCGGVYWTGHRTGRRSHAKYCSDRCRVAAMRARNMGRT
jgi:hypothetical protein